MFNWLWKKRPIVNNVTIDIKELKEIRDLMFPDYKLEQLPTGEVFHVDMSVDTNLDSVIYELEDGTNDETTRKTLRSISDTLFKVRKILMVEQVMHPDVKHIVFAQEENSEVQ